MKKIAGLQLGMGIGDLLTNYKRFNILKPERRMQITVDGVEWNNPPDLRHIKV